MKGGPDALGIETIKTFWSRDMKLLVLFMGEPKGELLELKELKGTVRITGTLTSRGNFEHVKRCTHKGKMEVMQLKTKEPIRSQKEERMGLSQNFQRT
jgi:hypothetical protein